MYLNSDKTVFLTGQNCIGWPLAFMQKFGSFSASSEIRARGMEVELAGAPFAHHTGFAPDAVLTGPWTHCGNRR